MAAAPQYATLTFVGLVTGKTYTKDGYLSDVANAKVNQDDGAGASSTSESFLRIVEPSILSDFSINTGMTDTTKIQITKNGVPTGDIIRFANHLNTLAFRPGLTIGYGSGDIFGAIQLA